MARRPRTTPAGNDPGLWAQVVSEAPVLDLSSIAALGERLLVVSAHPDDETIGAGRLVAEWSDAIGAVNVVTLTAGEACLDHVGARPDGIAERRLEEWRAACDDLGAVALGCCDLPDGGLEANVDDIGVIVRTLAPAYGAIAVPWLGDPHPDHQAAGRVARDVAAEVGLPLLAFPVWATYWLSPADVHEPLLRVRSGAAAEAARACALTRYPSQLEPTTPDLDPVVPRAMLEHHGAQLLVGEPV